MAETVDTYLSLITSLYRGRPKFSAWCAALAQRVVDAQNLSEQVRLAFDLETAVGVQLDQIGEWVGRSRRVSIPLTDVYFSWNIPGLGWGEGSWRGQFDPISGMVSLPDDAYRRLLKAKILANHWDGTIPQAYEIWETLYGDQGSYLVIQDNQDMSMSIGLAGTSLDAVDLALISGGYIPLKPEGVRVFYYGVVGSGEKLFCWNTPESEALGGWGTGSWAKQLDPASPTIPNPRLTDENGNFLVDEFGNYLVA